MIDHAVVIYTIIDDLLKARGHREDSRRQMSDAEIITTVVIASMVHGGVIEHARRGLCESGLIPRMLSKGRLCVRLGQITRLINSVFEDLSMIYKQLNTSNEFILDSFPLPISEDRRSRRSRLIYPASNRYICSGKNVSKNVYFFGFRLQLLVTAEKIPVEFALEPARYDDRRAFWSLPLALPAGSEIFTDSNYGKKTLEADVLEIEQIKLSPTRTRSYKLQDPPAEKDYKHFTRQAIECVFSRLHALLPRSIHVVTLRGFYRKVLCFVLALQFLIALL
jgi:hypothetical protein